MILYINSCVREDSRTDRLAKALLKKLGGDFTELKLADMNISPLGRDALDKRTKLIAGRDYSDTMFDLAKQFAAADKIVISAPFWDFSFPSLLKIYLENIYVTGIVSHYNENGVPEGLCKASGLWYVTTAGGEFVPDYCYNYLSALAKVCFGIPETNLIKAEMLDIVGNDAEKILQTAIGNL